MYWTSSTEALYDTEDVSIVILLLCLLIMTQLPPPSYGELSLHDPENTTYHLPSYEQSIQVSNK